MNIELLNLINYNVCWFFNYVGEKNWGIWCFFFLAESLESEKNYSDHSFRRVTCFLVFWPWFLCFFIFFSTSGAAWLDSSTMLMPPDSWLLFGTFVLVYFIFIFFCFSERERVHISQAWASINIIFIFAPLKFLTTILASTSSSNFVTSFF